jgi:transcriptional regulator with XRE-family HTH domain
MPKRSKDDMVYLSFAITLECVIEETVEELAKRLGMSQSTIRGMEDSMDFVPSSEQIAALRAGASEDDESFEWSDFSIEPDDQS